MDEQQLYNFCIKNTQDLIDGKLSIDKIIKLRAIDFSFDYYIDEICQEIITRISEKEDYKND